MLAILLFTVSLATSFYQTTVNGYSFSIANTPQQCQNLTISISGSGTPPYRAVIIPFGPSPLQNNVEVRKIMDLNFTGSSTLLSFKFPYPENSQFVVVVSDATGFGTGGTSVAAQVQTGSSDSSCYGTTQVSPDFPFSIVPTNQLVQCSPTRIWWDPTTVQGTPQFYGVIPGGQSFQIQEGSLSTVSSEGQGFNWTVPVRVGTTLMLVGGDSRGIGTAGSITQQVQQGISDVNNSCLDSNSPSSTPGTPAGGAYPTGSNGASTGGGNGSGSGSGSSGGSGKSSNTGAIVGGVVGGLIGLASLCLIALFFVRRHRFHEKRRSQNTVDLLHGDAEDGPSNGRGDLPQFYQPEPFVVPDPTIESSHDYTSEGDRRPSMQSSTDLMRSGTPDLLGVMSASGGSSSRKSPLGLPQLRPVNIIQHDDAGPDEGAETIELPPAYTNIRRKLTFGRRPSQRATSTTDETGGTSNAAAESSGTT